MGSLVDAVLIYIYMKYIHQWKDILSSEEVSNPQLESQQEESNEPSNEIWMEQTNEPSVESPIQTSFDQSNDQPIEPPLLDATIETLVTTIEQNIEHSNPIAEEPQIQVID